jgi:hypothetical protein
MMELHLQYSTVNVSEIPAKDWAQAFCKRHVGYRVARLLALD